MYIGMYGRPSVRSPLWAIQPGLRPSQPGLRPSQLSLKPEGGTNGRTDGRTNKQKISPFYRTLSPIGAAALPPPMKTKEKVEQGKGTADHLMPLGYLFLFDIQVSFILIPFFFLFFSFSSVFFFFFLHFIFLFLSLLIFTGAHLASAGPP